MSALNVPGLVLGRAGGGLEVANAGWAANAEVARVGRKGELATGALLDVIARRPGGPSVLHDVTIPHSRANVDHVVVSGSRVILIDSKVWRPAFYWTIAGHTFRGAERFSFADRDSMSFALERIGALLTRQGLAHQMAKPRLVVWPSSDKSAMHLWAYRKPGMRVASGASLGTSGALVLGRLRPARMDLVQSLSSLLPAAGSASAPHAA